MAKLLKRYKNAIFDFFYSFAAYALPTVTLQFAIYPLVARRLGPEENGLFLTLFNVVRLCVTVLVVSLAHMRLLNKKACQEKPEKDKSFNFLFVTVVGISMLVTVVFNLLYRGTACNIWDYLFLLAVLVLLCAHDYFAIAFRVLIDYKLLLADNFLIIVGYAIGCVLFWLLGRWELIFICGYALGLGFVLLKSVFWRRGIGTASVKQILPEYSQLCASSGLNNATVYCDKMLIYPMLGGHAVSVYNAAAIVSKVMAIISSPIRNVLLSYIVDIDSLRVQKRTLQKGALLCTAGAGVVYGGFYLASLVLCRLLYPQFYQEAYRFIPVILFAILMETAAGIVKTILLRFAKASLQIWTSGIKIGIYLTGVFISSLLNMGLLGFCFAILFADAAQLIMAGGFLFKIITANPPGNKENQSGT